MDIISKLRDEFNNKYANSSKIKNLVEKLENGDVEYGQAHEFAIEVGEMLANVFKENLSVDMFPDGKISYGIADKILNETLGKNYDLISDYSRDIQTIINKKAGFNIKGVRAEKNQSRIDNMVKKVSDDNFENVQWMFDEPVKNFSQSIVDDTVKTNADFQYKLGMQPKIIRKSTGHCCDWCEALVGEYDYPYEVPPDVYRRHRFCRCTVEYYPGGKKKQNVHTKKWTEIYKSDKIKKRIEMSQERKDENIRLKNIAYTKANELGYNPLSQEKVVDILRRDSDIWIENLTEEEKKAISKYTYNGKDKDGLNLFEKINGYLEGNYNPENEKEEIMILNYYSNIKNALLKNNLDSDIIVYRNDISPESLNKTMNKFLSTSVSQRGVIGGKPNVAIIVPKNSNGAYIERLSFDNFKKQREFLLNSETQLEFIDNLSGDMYIYKVKEE
ncbi:MAG: ADP-ribosyltransferase [Peptoanaerobacter stomatis]|uniref:ADP-ribosyltransferase n=1 Tax=Peptoanaerobacter stomatis TaxID=796937 RepID=UPI003FA01DD4